MTWQVCQIRSRQLQTKASALIRCLAEGVISHLRGGGSNAPLSVCAAACVDTASASTTSPPATEDVGRSTVSKSGKGGGDTRKSTDGARRYVARARFPATRGRAGVAGFASSVVDAVDHYGGLAGARQLSVRVRNDGGR